MHRQPIVSLIHILIFLDARVKVLPDVHFIAGGLG